MLVRFEGVRYSDTEILPLIVKLDMEEINSIKVLSDRNKTHYRLVIDRNINGENKTMSVEFIDHFAALAALEHLWIIYNEEQSKKEILPSQGFYAK
jgi:hypothetical protein